MSRLLHLERTRSSPRAGPELTCKTDLETIDYCASVARYRFKLACYWKISTRFLLHSLCEDRLQWPETPVSLIYLLSFCPIVSPFPAVTAFIRELRLWACGTALKLGIITEAKYLKRFLSEAEGWIDQIVLVSFLHYVKMPCLQTQYTHCQRLLHPFTERTSASSIYSIPTVTFVMDNYRFQSLSEKDLGSCIGTFDSLPVGVIISFYPC